MEQRTNDPMAKALRELMTERGITDGIELSGIAEVSNATVSLYLSGKRGTRMNSQALRTVEKFAAALKVSPTYFLEYREALAHKMVSEGMRRGKIDLEDIELFLTGWTHTEKTDG